MAAPWQYDAPGPDAAHDPEACSGDGGCRCRCEVCVALRRSVTS